MHAKWHQELWSQHNSMQMLASILSERAPKSAVNFSWAAVTAAASAAVCLLTAADGRKCRHDRGCADLLLQTSRFGRR